MHWARRNNTELTTSRVSQACQYWEGSMVFSANTVTTLGRHSSFPDCKWWQMIPTCLQLFINFLLSVPPVSYMVHMSVSKSLSMRMNELSLCSLFTVTWLSLTDPEWKALWHKYMDTELGAHWGSWHLPQYCSMQKMPPSTTPCWENKKGYNPTSSSPETTAT